ncbi:hypothetical protein GCM10009774_06920 [Cellulomonas gelida]|uniref:Uncharacterized protein n=1 Tax=Cellulomonas gelida TaxID=1712 RepID=A0A4Y3KM42_9CELL|nr:hypothetical protein CGE01nite_14560 [Cellulomonas gelida]GGL19226.1 hypothetical protein GCM10009774_06920 [Cellulomonas gelida]
MGGPAGSAAVAGIASPAITSPASAAALVVRVRVERIVFLSSLLRTGDVTGACHRTRSRAPRGGRPGGLRPSGAAGRVSDPQGERCGSATRSAVARARSARVVRRASWFGLRGSCFVVRLVVRVASGG